MPTALSRSRSPSREGRRSQVSSATTSLRGLLISAVLLMAVIVAWRISGPAAGLIDTYRIHVSLMTHSTSPVPPKPAVRYVVIPPKLCQP
jgi:hypothetical protein